MGTMIRVTYKCRNCGKKNQECYVCGPQRTYNDDTNADFMGSGELRLHKCKENVLWNRTMYARFRESLGKYGVAEIITLEYY